MWITQNESKTEKAKKNQKESKMVFIIIGTVEYVRVLYRLQTSKNNAVEQVIKHNKKLQEYMDAQERHNESRRRNGQALNEKIDFHFAQKVHYEQLADKYREDIRVFQNSFLHDGLPGTPEEWASRIGTTLQARIDFEIQTGRRQEPKEEIKEEPLDEGIKQEPLDEEIKEEPIAMPNVIKSEPQ